MSESIKKDYGWIWGVLLIVAFTTFLTIGLILSPPPHGQQQANGNAGDKPTSIYLDPRTGGISPLPLPGNIPLW